jgi:hypothetical protein
MKSVTSIIAASLVLAASVGARSTVASSESGPSAEGYIYGTVQTKSGKAHTGVLRWDDEEAFWDDLFHSGKHELPYGEYAEAPDPDEAATWWERMARTIGGEVGIHRESRIVAVRFGDLARVRPTGGTSAVLTLRDGTELEVEGYANDVGATVMVLDEKPGRVEVAWRQIETVTFAATPADADPGSFRIRGTVVASGKEFSGFIQWDSQECLSTDLLDGDDGDERISLAMGEIRSIERRDRRSALVVLKDGTEYTLSGTNDVNDDIRGIHVEDPRFGRVEVPWEEFEKVVFDDPGSSGRSYDDFAAPVHLSGRVVLENGDWRRGKLVFDLDEEWSWEMLDGSADGIDYTVPFGLVASIEPEGRSGSLVTLRDGRRIELEDSHDVDDDNSGVVVIPIESGEPAQVSWQEISRIEFD